MKLNFSKMKGLVPAIVQDAETKDVLMLGFMNEEAYEKTLKDRRVCFFSRSKNRLWQKGETSGNYLEVVSINVDCDNDSLLIMAKPSGPVCHKGSKSCFGIENFSLENLFKIIESRKSVSAEKSYTSLLFKGGLPKILAKIAEESLEVIKAAEKEGKIRLKEESCDLLYHLFVLLSYEGLNMEDIKKELAKRNGD